MLLDALNEKGYDGAEIAARAGLSRDDFADPNARFGLDRTSAFWRLAVAETGDDAIGIWVSKYVQPTTFHALGLAVSASRNWHEALSRMERYSVLVSNSEAVAISVEVDHWVYSLRPVAEAYRASPESLDAIMSHMVRASRGAVKGFVTPLSVAFARPKPSNHAAFRDFYKCPITYDAPVNRIILPLDLLHAPLVTTNSALAEQGDSLVAAYLDQIVTDPIDTKIRQSIVEALPSGDISIQQVARDVGMSVRSLQRYLSDKGGTFSGLIGDIRGAIAKTYLAQKKLPITEIAFLLGYSDTASFSRAFKAWTDMTPRQYQQQS